MIEIVLPLDVIDDHGPTFLPSCCNRIIRATHDAAGSCVTDRDTSAPHSESYSRANAWSRSLAVHVDLRADQDAQWRRQLLRDALETIVSVADAGGGKVIVVDADNEGLLAFYLRNGFKTTGTVGDLALYMKVSTARAALTA